MTEPAGKLLKAIICLFIVCVTAQTAAADVQDYPNSSVKYVVPYSPWSAADSIGRLTAARLEEALRVPVIVEDKSGAAGNIACDYLAKSAPDGYNIGTVATAVTGSISLDKNLPYHTFRDFTPIGLNAVLHLAVVVNRSLPIRNIRELGSYAKSNPGKLTFGSAGVGTGSHLSVELLRMLADIDITHASYKGTANALPDLLENRISLMFDFVPLAIEHIKADKLRAIAVTMKNRSPLLPEVPTIKESGIPQYEFTNRFGVAGPTGIPPDIVTKLNAAIVRGMNGEALCAELIQRGGEVVTRTPQKVDL
ncbi:MAG: tripartite tricarboxylate transporter substrate binding protein [Pseudorhodoplanes sp.]|nr:tripartite tricarboxylate transporter substrate binding protein [Pseudorhodoplanes sp.]